MTNTLCDLKTIVRELEQANFKFKKALGQNFLTDSSVPARMASSLPLGFDAIEIGPGFGCLTFELAQKASRVVCVEKDNSIVPLLRRNLSLFGNIEILESDALKVCLPAIAAERNMRPECCEVFGNLPYSITGALLQMLIQSGFCFTVMVQREVANRLVAVPGRKDYGSLTVFSNVFGECERLFDIPPESFVPQPKVTSSVIRWVRRQNALVPNDIQEHFFAVVRSAFMLRRKTLPNALEPLCGKQLASSALEECRIDTLRRGETLDVGEFAALTNTLCRRGAFNKQRGTQNL